MNTMYEGRYTWDGGEENPFMNYLNSDTELIQEV